MELTVPESSGGGNFIQVPAGIHLACCYRIIDLGTQNVTYMGQSKMSRKVLFQFEVHTENSDGTPLLTPDGKPLSISKQYTRSLGENAIMRRDLQSWRGKVFEKKEVFRFQNILGQWCMINVVHTSKDGKTYANIDSITPVPAAIKKNGLPDAANAPVLFSIENADMAVFETFSDYIKDKIKSSPEWEAFGKHATPAPAEKGADFDDFESDIPF